MKKPKVVKSIRVMSDNNVKPTDLETRDEKAQRMMADEDTEIVGVYSTSEDRCKCKLIDCHCGLGYSNNKYECFSDEVAVFETAESDSVITRGNAKELLEDEAYLKRVDKAKTSDENWSWHHSTEKTHQVILDKSVECKDGVVW
jgi:hypothetical protein